MTAKRVPSKGEPTPPTPPSLTIPRSEADKQLASRIDIGKGFLNLAIHSEEDYEKAQHSYYVWHDYNTELLRRIFDSEELSKEYSFWGVSRSADNFTDEIRYLLGDIKNYVGRLESIKERLPLYPESSQLSTVTLHRPTEPSPRATRDVFVVHGTDQGAKDTVARFLSKLKLDPRILHEQPNLGKTIIEKLEHNSVVAFSVVLLTSDDKGCPISDDSTFKPRARQNVVFELGYFIAKLGRKNVCALYSQGVELPSDFDGVVYIPFDKEGAWQFRLAKEIKAAGLDIDLNDAV